MRKLHHPVPEDCVRAIGSITVYFSMLEGDIKSLIGLLLLGNVGDQRLSSIFTEELSFKKLLDLLGALFHYRFEGQSEKLEELKKLIRRAVQVEEERNKIIHSSWAAWDPGMVTRFKVTAKQKGLRRQFEKMSVADLDQIAEKISVVAMDFTDFNLRLTGITRGV